MPARFVTTALVTKSAGIAARFVTLVTKRAVVTKRAETCRSDKTCRNNYLFIAGFEYPPKWCTYSAIWLLHDWCRVKLLPPRGSFCVHHTTTHQFTVSLR